jgi:hypothetical protein
MRFPLWTNPRGGAEFVDLFIHDRRVYIPTSGKTRDALFRYDGSFQECELEEEQLLQALEVAYGKGNPRIRQPSQRDYEKRQPFQVAMRMRSRGEMARRGVLRAAIWWFPDHIDVVFSPRGAKDIEAHDPKAKRWFPAGTSLSSLMKHVLAEWQSRQADDAGGVTSSRTIDA